MAVYERSDPNPSRYQKVKALGEGTYGKVWKAWDHQRNTFVAIKEIKSESDIEEGIPATTVREIATLQ
jgi:CTD kinase subunit alpha